MQVELIFNYWIRTTYAKPVLSRWPILDAQSFTFYLTATYLSIFFNKMWNRNYEKDIFLSVKDFINTNINSRHLESKLEIINRDSNVYKHVYKGDKFIS